MATKKIIVWVIAVISIIILCFGVAGCANNTNGDEVSVEPTMKSTSTPTPTTEPTPTPTHEPTNTPEPEETISIDFLQGVWIDPDYTEEVSPDYIRYSSVFVIQESEVSWYELQNDGNELSIGGLSSDEESYPLVDNGENKILFEWTYREKEPEDVWFTYVDSDHIEMNRADMEPFPLERTTDQRVLDALEDYYNKEDFSFDGIWAHEEALDPDAKEFYGGADSIYYIYAINGDTVRIVDFFKYGESYDAGDDWGTYTLSYANGSAEFNMDSHTEQITSVNENEIEIQSGVNVSSFMRVKNGALFEQVNNYLE